MSDFAFGAVPPPEVDRDLIEPDEVLAPGEAPPLRGDGDPDAPDASEAQVRAMLAGLGGIVSFGIGNREIEGHWRFTEDELRDMTPPLTRMVNASPRLKAIVARSDMIAFALVLTRYGLRNVDEQRKWARDHPDTEPDPVPLQHAAGGGGLPGGAQADHRGAAGPGHAAGDGGHGGVPGAGA